MKTVVTALTNQKGGVGKTTTTINLAAALANRGKKTLLIDLDPQANATSGLGVDKHQEQTIYSVLVDGVPLEEVVLETEQKNLFVAPSELDLAGAEVEIARMEDPPQPTERIPATGH